MHLNSVRFCKRSLSADERAKERKESQMQAAAIKLEVGVTRSTPSAAGQVAGRFAGGTNCRDQIEQVLLTGRFDRASHSGASRLPPLGPQNRGPWSPTGSATVVSTAATRAPGGPSAHHARKASTAAGSPSTSIRTAPSGSLRTQPVRPRRRASR